MKTHKNHSLLQVVAVFALAASGGLRADNRVVQVSTTLEGVTTTMREYSNDEAAKLYRNKEFVNTIGVYASQQQMGGMRRQQGPRQGYMFQQQDDNSSKRDDMSRMHQDIRPFSIEIINKSDKDIVVQANNYISTFVGAAIPMNKLLELYPDLISRAQMLKILACAPLFMSAYLCSKPSGPSTSILVPNSFNAKVFVCGGGIGVACFMWWLASKYDSLMSHIEKIPTVGPRIVTATGTRHLPLSDNTYVIPAGATLQDTLFVRTSAMSFSGATTNRPTLQTMSF